MKKQPKANRSRTRNHRRESAAPDADKTAREPNNAPREPLLQYTVRDAVEWMLDVAAVLAYP